MFPSLLPTVTPALGGTLHPLQVVWFCAIVVLWIGYFVLEGFDYGVAMHLPILGKNNNDRRVMINTVGPVWDGNEVWLLTAGGATFAAFPGWYATLFSALYLPLLLVLLGLIMRGLAFEYRAKRDSDSWRAAWDWAATIGSFLPSLVFGVGVANFIKGLPVDSRQLFAGTFLGLFTPFTLLGGVMFVALFLTHGATFLGLKTKGAIRERARRFAGTSAFVTAALVAIFGVWAVLAYGARSASTIGNWILAVGAIALLVVAGLMVRRANERVAFICTAVAIALLTVCAFLFMFPNLGFDNAANQGTPLDITTAASTTKTLTIMTVAAVIFLPIVLAYQAWTYWVFRKRISTANLPVEGPAETVPTNDAEDPIAMDNAHTDRATTDVRTVGTEGTAGSATATATATTTRTAGVGTEGHGATAARTTTHDDGEPRP